MADSVDVKTCVVVPSWNGADSLPACLDSLQVQSFKATIIVVENGSTDGSLELLKEKYPAVTLVVNQRNLGFAGGVNGGIQKAIDLGAKYVALFNNDARADNHWLKQLVACLENNPDVGIATCKFLSDDGQHIDSTGDYYTVWGLPYPRGRGESDLTKYDDQPEIFAASGGASLYRVEMLEQIGLFDEDFFAYYEDVDISFRAQLAGWRVRYEPKAIAYHQIGATSAKIKGFTTYQTMKNLSLLFYKNVPRPYRKRIGRRLLLAQSLFMLRAFSHGQGWSAIKGDLKGDWLNLHKRGQRRRIQANKKVTNEYIWDMVVHDLPPNAIALRKLRNWWWKVRGKNA